MSSVLSGLQVKEAYMIRVLIPSDFEFLFYESECKALYESVQESIGDSNSFEFIVKNTLFYLFVNDNKLIGAIYYFLDEDEKLFLNGFANRKMHLLNLECLKMSLGWFKGEIYAQAQNKMSALCLRKCGFEEVEKGIYVFINKKNNQVGDFSGKETYVF